MELGNTLRAYEHSHTHFEDVLILHWANLFFILFLPVAVFFNWESSPIWFKWLSVIGVTISVWTIYANYKQVNNRPSVVFYENGFVMEGKLHVYGSLSEQVIARWNDIIEVSHPVPDWIEHRMLEFKVILRNGENILIPQSISKYAELYNEFTQRGIRGSDSELSIYPIDYIGWMKSKNVTPITVINAPKKISNGGSN